MNKFVRTVVKGELKRYGQQANEVEIARACAAMTLFTLVLPVLYVAYWLMPENFKDNLYMALMTAPVEAEL